MTYRTRTVRALLLASCLAAVGATPALAQEAATSPAAAPSSDSDIVVTAQKRDERLIDVPIPVSVVSTKMLTAENDAQLRDYFTRLPGLSLYSAGNGRSTFVVRGISTGAGNNPTVAVVLDDVPLGSSTGAGLGDQVSSEIDPSDVQQVEVLRGPQGTLYGASSLGGLIKYVSVKPDATKYSGSVSVNGEAIDGGGLGWATRGAINIPIIDDVLAVRASGYFRHDAGWVDDATSGAKNVNNAHAAGGKISALWTPTSDLSILATAVIQHRKSFNVSDEDVDINGTPVYGKNLHSRVPGTGLGDKNTKIFSVRAAYDFGFASLTSITSYSRISFVGPQDVSQTFIPLLTEYGILSDATGVGAVIANNAYSRKWTQEWRLASEGKGPLQWQVGTFYTREKNKSDQDIYAVYSATGAPYDLYGMSIDTAKDPDTYREFAAYGDVTYNFTDALALQLGGRYAWNRQSDVETLGGILSSDDEGNPVTSSMKSKDHAFTFLVSPSYHITHNLMLYSRIASGYRPGGPNIVPVTSAFRSYGPDRTVNYDIGLKGEVIDRLLSVDLAVFDIEWKKIQLSETDTASALSYTGNGGKARSRGVEASATLTPWQGMNATGTFTYTDATLREDVDVTSLYGSKGDRLPYSAKYAASFDAEQDFALPGNVQGFLGGTVAYTGKRYSDFAHTAGAQRFEMPEFTTVSLRAGVRNGGWSYSLYVRNLTNKVAFLSGNPRNTISRTGTYAAGVIQPRTIGLSIGKDF